MPSLQGLSQKGVAPKLAVFKHLLNFLQLWH